MPADHIEYSRLDGHAAGAIVDALAEVYADVYAEPPYHWGDEHVALFRERFDTQRRQPGFELVGAWDGDELIAFTFGVTLQPTTPWWSNLLTDLLPEFTREWTGRTFAVVELLVRRPWRRRGIARHLHDLLLTDRPEERATLTVLPEATAAQAAYRAWGWQRIAQKSNPLPGSPVFDVEIKPLSPAE